MTKKETCDYYVEEDDEEQTPLDQFGNRVDGTTMEWCCSPDCGCPEARLCMASREPMNAIVVFSFQSTRKID